MVTLAAVDNGVLQITDFTTPDPYAQFYSKRALEVADYDLYPLLFPEIQAALSSTGGDGDSYEKTDQPHARQKDQNPLLLEWHRPGQRQRRSQL